VPARFAFGVVFGELSGLLEHLGGAAERVGQLASEVGCCRLWRRGRLAHLSRGLPVAAPARTWPWLTNSVAQTRASTGATGQRDVIIPATGTSSVAYTFYGPLTASAWGNLNAQLYTGASQCADFQAQIASFQESPSIPGDPSVFGSVIPPPDRMVRAAESRTKTFDGNTITLSMTDSSLVGAPATCVTAAITHRGFLDQVGPLASPSAPPPPPPPGTTPPPALNIAIKSTHVTASQSGLVKVALKPFNQAATGAVTMRQGGKQIGRATYKAKSGAAVTVSIKLSPAARRSLKRHRSLLVTVTATAQAGTQVATKAIRARVRR
jgi:hypothetical protein